MKRINLKTYVKDFRRRDNIKKIDFVFVELCQCTKVLWCFTSCLAKENIHLLILKLILSIRSQADEAIFTKRHISLPTTTATRYY